MGTIRLELMMIAFSSTNRLGIMRLQPPWCKDFGIQPWP